MHLLELEPANQHHLERAGPEKLQAEHFAEAKNPAAAGVKHLQAEKVEGNGLTRGKTPQLKRDKGQDRNGSGRSKRNIKKALEAGAGDCAR